MLPITARIVEKREVAAETWRFELQAADGGPLPAFTVGAHINGATPSGDVRSYSLTDEPADGGHYAITVHRAPESRGGSASLVSETAVGDRLQISGPANAFPLEDAPSYLLIAGGIGITPIRSMFRWLRRQGCEDVRLLYLTRSRALTPYLEEFSAPDVADYVDLHHDEDAGLVDLWPYLAQPRTTHVYCCGPGRLLEEVLALTMHWSPSTVHFERFSGVPALGASSAAFKARWRPTGEVIDVPAQVTFLDALAAHGKDVASSCRSGTCGTCRLRLVSGDVDHRDLVLTADEQATAADPVARRRRPRHGRAHEPRRRPRPCRPVQDLPRRPSRSR